MHTLTDKPSVWKSIQSNICDGIYSAKNKDVSKTHHLITKITGFGSLDEEQEKEEKNLTSGRHGPCIQGSCNLVEKKEQFHIIGKGEWEPKHCF